MSDESIYELYYGKELRIYLYGNKSQKAVELSIELILQLGHKITISLEESDIAIAPNLRQILSLEELNKPKYGTLIFHPSLLPRHRGRDAIKWTYRENEQYSGVTWFWGNIGLDTGDICEQEIIPMQYNLTPREFYESIVLKAMKITLERCLNDISRGIVRKRIQNEDAATYEPPIKKTPK